MGARKPAAAVAVKLTNRVFDCIMELQSSERVRDLRPDHAGLWRVIYIAHGEAHARKIEDLLRQAGFLIDRRRLSLENAGDDIEIRALVAEAEEARLYLMEQGL